MPEQILRNAETATAESGGNSGDDAVDEARAAESVEGDSFVSSVAGKDEPSDKKRKSRFSLKKKGPLIAIFALLVLFGGLIFLAQSAMPFAIVNRLIEEYNTNGISSVLRADNILDLQLSSSSGSLLALDQYQRTAFIEQNILPVSSAGGTLLAYQNYNDEWTLVAGSSQVNADANNVMNDLRSQYDSYDFSRVASPTIVNIETAMQDGPFKIGYTAASKTWRGGNSGWYDELAELGEKVNGYSRSRWFKYAGNVASTTFASLARSAVDNFSAGDAIDTSYSFEQGGTSDSGRTELTRLNPQTGEEERITLGYDGEGTQNTLADRLGLAAKFTSYAKTGVTLACAVVDGLMGVQTLLSTYNRLQKINLVSGYMEAVQSVQAGSEKSDPMHEYNNRLTTAESGKTAIEADGMNALFNGEKIDGSNESVKSVNVEGTLYSTRNSNEASDISSLIGSFASNANDLLTALTVCNYASATLSFISAGLTIASFFTGGLSGLISLGFKKILQKVIFAVIQTLAPQIIKGAILKIGNKLIEDMATEWLGEDLGNAMIAGGNSLLSSNHQIGGGSPGSPAKVSAFKRTQNEVIAEEAEYQRATRSPFDTTSQYTFLGSIVYSLVPMANSAGVGTAMKNISTLLSNSVTSLLPSASAIAESKMVNIAEVGECPLLDTLGIQGDMYCNPIYITDNESFDTTPEEVIRWEGNNVEVDADGKVTALKPNTDLTKYILYCGQRTSNWGIADANIAEKIHEGNSSGSILSWIAPDIDSALTAIQDQQNLPWITGQACVASESKNPDWYCKNQMHQRFVEDQRLFSNEKGDREDNPVAAYLKDYYDANPLDNSFEGILARYSGMTKDDVIATLELMEGLNYIANYDPSTRIAFGKEESNTDIQFEQTEETLIAVEPKYIFYNTIRNRTKIV